MGGERALRHVTATAATALVLACGMSRQQRAYLVDGLRRRADCEFIDTFGELERLLPSRTQCDALVIAPRDAEGRDATGVVEQVARDWPDTAIVVFCPSGSDSAPALRSLVLAGAHEIVFEGVHDTAGAVALAVENARRESAAEMVFARLQQLIPTPLHSMVHAILARPDTRTSVGAVAEAMGIHRKTLVNRCSQSGFLQPGEVVSWCRLAMVGYFLERTGSTIEAIGIRLGFASHTALRNLMKRYTHRTATEVREGGGLEVVIRALEARIVGRDRAGV